MWINGENHSACFDRSVTTVTSKLEKGSKVIVGHENALLLSCCQNLSWRPNL